MERRLRILLTGAALVLAAGCSTVQTTAAFDEKADFSGYRTFSWFRTGADPDDSWAPRLAAVVRDALGRRGIAEVESGADLWAVTDWRLSWGPVGSPGGPFPVPVGYGPQAGNMARGVSSSGEAPVLTVFVDLIDAKKRHVVFRGIASRELTPSEARDEREKFLREVVDELLKKVPSTGR